MKMINKNVIATALIVLMLVTILAGCQNDVPVINDPNLKVDDKIKRFESAEQLKEAFEKAQQTRGDLYYGAMEKGMIAETAVQATSAPSAVGAADSAAGKDFSTTNIQVEGVDEADIIKTDGEYIYAIAKGKLYIAKAYPAEEAKILSNVELEGFEPQEMFIHEDRLLVFGYEESISKTEQPAECVGDESKCSYMSMVCVELFDTADKTKPQLMKTVGFEGNYLTSRKIGENAYVVINSWPRYGDFENPIDIIPLYKEDSEELKPIAQPTEIGYIEPLYAQNFITVAAISMTDKDKEVSKEVIAGSGQNVYASLENLYIAQTVYPTYDAGKLVENYTEKTVITKFALDDGKITFIGNGAVKGNILNQFSMDEFKENFRIATTIQGYDYVNNRDTSSNNMYVLNKNLDMVGKVEEIAPGESIYSVRFMGNRAYMVTFKHVDPLFVIDLSEPTNPKILGKLKIPGYSEYLHPYDETHLIGLGKEVDESIDADKVHTEGAVYYTAIQGVKLAIFDVSDVSNPIELHKEVIGDRGTQSLAAQEHKAFLFDKEKGLLVIPLTVAELQEGQDKSHEGEFTFQGAYVYDVSLDDGFKLRGRVTHDTDDQAMLKSDYYYDYSTQIKRSLYIDNILYTMSDRMLKMNDLTSLDELNSVKFE